MFLSVMLEFDEPESQGHKYVILGYEKRSVIIRYHSSNVIHVMMFIFYDLNNKSKKTFTLGVMM